MRDAVVRMLDTERSPTRISEEIVSTLELDSARTDTIVRSAVVRTHDGEAVAVSDRKEKTR